MPTLWVVYPHTIAAKARSPYIVFLDAARRLVIFNCARSPGCRPIAAGGPHCGADAAIFTPVGERAACRRSATSAGLIEFPCKPRTEVRGLHLTLLRKWKSGLETGNNGGDHEARSLGAAIRRLGDTTGRHSLVDGLNNGFASLSISWGCLTC